MRHKGINVDDEEQKVNNKALRDTTVHYPGNGSLRKVAPTHSNAKPPISHRDVNRMLWFSVSNTFDKSTNTPNCIFLAVRVGKILSHKSARVGKLIGFTSIRTGYYREHLIYSDMTE